MFWVAQKILKNYLRQFLFLERFSSKIKAIFAFSIPPSWLDSNPQPLYKETSVLPLCFNCWPSYDKTFIIFGKINDDRKKIKTTIFFLIVITLFSKQ
jgi:hypothetical protein